MRLLSRSAAAMTTAVLVAAPVQAQGWTQGPDGEAVYVAPYSTSGTFSCRPLGSLPGSCRSIDNGIELTNGAASATFRFFGTSGTMTATAYGNPISIGRIETSFTGSAPFEWPASTTPWLPFAALGMSFNLAGSGSQFWGSEYVNYGTLDDVPPNCCEGRRTYIGFGIPRTPLRPYGSVLVIDRLTGAVLSSETSGTREVFATANIAPEPSTWALLGTGLLTLGGIAARRRKRADA